MPFGTSPRYATSLAVSWLSGLGVPASWSAWSGREANGEVSWQGGEPGGEQAGRRGVMTHDSHEEGEESQAHGFSLDLSLCYKLMFFGNLGSLGKLFI